MHDEDLRYRDGRLPKWLDHLPAGTLRAVYLHWSAGDYTTTFPSYHACVTLDADGTPEIAQTHDFRANMRDVRGRPGRPYAAHTRGRNAFAAGVSIMAMKDARPDDFGAFPIVEAQIDALCALTKRICAVYAIPVLPNYVMTHAEAALIDGYFGANEEERWDIARLAPSTSPLTPAEAVATGDILRRRILSI